MTSYDDTLAMINSMSPDELSQLAVETNKILDGVKFIPFPGTQTRAYFSEADILLFGGRPGGGKELCKLTEVPVPLSTDPSGFKRHGDIRVGDEVYSPSGKAVRVLHVHPDDLYPDSYEVVFNTGERVRCDGRHKWQTMDNLNRRRQLRSTDTWRENRRVGRPSRAVAKSKKPWVSKSISLLNSQRKHIICSPATSILTTDEIRDSLVINGKNNHSIAIIDPIECGHQDLPCDPYLFGLWLGDGHTNKTIIGMMDKDMRQISCLLPNPRSVKSYKQKSDVLFTVSSYSELKFASKIGGKHIPSQYLRASIDQRKELLCGIMDTDGTVDERGQCELGFSNERLAYDALDLINGLGLKCTIRKKELSKKNKNHKDHYRLKFIADFPVFKLKRKSDRQRPIIRDTAKRRYIVDVVKCDPVPMNCITVEGGLYCVGRTYITTHNSALGCGLALQEHDRTLFVRRQFSDLRPATDLAKKLARSSKGFVGGMRPLYNKPDGGVIHFMGLSNDGDLGGKQGEAHDLIFFDEVAQMSEDPVRTLIGWLRSDDPDQRCRIVMGSNPPLDSTGDWLVPFFAPWLDDTYPNPAKEGELRWFLRRDGVDVECDKDDFVMLDGKKVGTHSRTYISSDYADNPYYDTETYTKTLAQMGERERKILMSGNFLTARGDAQWQTIPTQWIIDAQRRWKKEDGRGKPLVALGADVTGGGSDVCALALAHDGLWFDEMQVKSGKDLPDSSDVAAFIVKHRKGQCGVGIDMGGGYGGGPKSLLEMSGVDVVKFVPQGETNERDRDKVYGFRNIRSLAYWRLREMLDPDQDGGAVMALPPSKKLLSDLATPLYETKMFKGRLCIHLEDKESIKKRINRSPDEGDAVAIALYTYMKNQKAVNNKNNSSIGKGPISASLGYEHRKRKR